jgi:hypothetical protein
MGIKIDRYISAHCTKYQILKTPKHLPLLPPPAMKPAVWPVERAISTPSAHSPIRTKRVENLCIVRVRRGGEEVFWLGPAGSSGDYVGSNFSCVNDVDGVG